MQVLGVRNSNTHFTHAPELLEGALACVGVLDGIGDFTKKSPEIWNSHSFGIQIEELPHSVPLHLWMVHHKVLNLISHVVLVNALPDVVHQIIEINVNDDITSRFDFSRRDSCVNGEAAKPLLVSGPVLKIWKYCSMLSTRLCPKPSGRQKGATSCIWQSEGMNPVLSKYVNPFSHREQKSWSLRPITESLHPSRSKGLGDF